MTVDLARWQFGDHHRLPLPVRPAHDRPVVPRGRHADRLGAHRRRPLPALTKFWGKLFLINFAIGVVTGIVQEFQFGMNWSDYSPLRRRHLRRAAGDGGAARVLPRVDLPRPVDLRLGPAAEAGAPGVHLARRDRHDAVGVLHPGRQLVDAAPGRLRRQRRRRPRRAEGLRRRADQLTALGAFPHTIAACFLTAGVFVPAISAVAPAPGGSRHRGLPPVARGSRLVDRR